MEKLKGIAILITSWFSLAMLVMGPFLFWEMIAAESATTVTAIVKSSRYEQRGRNCALRFEATLINSNKVVKIGDPRPGDIGFCSDKKRMAAKYKSGQQTQLLKVNDDYYLEKGNYKVSIIVFFSAIAWLAYLFIRVKRDKGQSEIQQDTSK